MKSLARIIMGVCLLGCLTSCPLKSTESQSTQPITDLLSLVSITDLPGDGPCHTQGLAVSGPYLFASCVDRASKKAWIYRYLMPERFPYQPGVFGPPKKLDVTREDMYHPSGLISDDECVWVAVAHYRKENARSRVICLDPESLVERSSFEVDDHIGALMEVLSEDQSNLAMFNWDSRDILVYSRDGHFISRGPAPSGTAFQDCSLEFCAGPGRMAGKSGAIVESLRPSPSQDGGFFVETSHFISYPGVNLGREGFELVAGPCWIFLPEDFPRAKVYVFTTNE